MTHPNPKSSEPPNDADRQQRIQQLTDDCLRRWSAGESIAVTDVIRSYPELAPELGKELQKARVVAGAIGLEPTTTPPPDEADVTATLDQHEIGHYKSRSSRGLHVRCPHCRHPIEMLLGAPLSDVTCNSCGSNFSLLGSDSQNDQAMPLKTLGHFELISRLGIGGFGSV